MSLILDALKKLEKDKITRRKRSVQIASDILLSGEPEARRKTRILITGLAGIALAAVALALVFTNPFSTRSPAPPQEKMQAPPAASTVPEPPAKVPPASDRIAKSSPKPKDVAVKQQARTATAHPPRIDDDTSSVAVTPSKKRVVSKTFSEKKAASDSTPLPVFIVSGIVWAEERGSRRAMVNGMVVSVGGNVEGAKVTEIHPDHVRFSHNGRNFSVYMK